MRYQHLIETIYHRPWFITAGGHASVQRVLQSALAKHGPAALISNDDESDEDALDRMDRQGMSLADFTTPRPALAIDAEGIATLTIRGPMARGLSKLQRVCGATGYEQIAAEFAQAEAQARGTLIRMETPGGTVTGCPETAAIIANRTKPCVVHISGVGASGGYYLAASADAIIAEPSAQVGSIGVLFAWVDFREKLANEGLRPNPITNKEGDLKGIGFRGELTATEREFLQGEADSMFTEFRNHVLAYRDIPAEAMRGQCLFGQAALAANLIDAHGSEAEARARLKQLIGSAL